jgi:hypothetical protein
MALSYTSTADDSNKQHYHTPALLKTATTKQDFFMLNCQLLKINRKIKCHESATMP